MTEVYTNVRWIRHSVLSSDNSTYDDSNDVFILEV